MVSDNSIEFLKTLNPGQLPEIIEISSELPSVIHVNILVGILNRWLQIRDVFNRPVRVYAISNNAQVEKYMVGLVNRYNDLYLTVLPETRKEWLSD